MQNECYLTADNSIKGPVGGGGDLWMGLRELVMGCRKGKDVIFWTALDLEVVNMFIRVCLSPILTRRFTTTPMVFLIDNP